MGDGGGPRGEGPCKANPPSYSEQEEEPLEGLEQRCRLISLCFEGILLANLLNLLCARYHSGAVNQTHHSADDPDKFPPVIEHLYQSSYLSVCLSVSLSVYLSIYLLVGGWGDSEYSFAHGEFQMSVSRSSGRIESEERLSES